MPSADDIAREQCVADGHEPDEVVSGCKYGTGPDIEIVKYDKTGLTIDVRRPRWHLYRERALEQLRQQ
jgi:hypothetical protein